MSTKGIETTIDRSPLLVENIPCASHTLNLIATSDFQKVLDASAPLSLKENCFKSFGKLKKLWNLHNRIPKLLKFFFRELSASCQAKTPGETRWNSMYNSAKHTMSHDEKKLATVFKKLKLDPVGQCDRDLLEEFLTVVKHIAHYLDIMQKERNNFLGCLILCIQKLKQELIDLKVPQELKSDEFDVTMRRGLLFHIKRRFDPLLERESFMLASASHPRFKFNFIPAEDEFVAAKVRKLFEKELKKNRNAPNRPANVNVEDDELALSKRMSPA